MTMQNRHEKYKIRNDDFPSDFRQVAQCIGLDSAIKLIEAFSGVQVYIPKYESVMRPIRNRAIKNEFDGSNYKRLACRYGLSERRVRDILRSK